MLPFFVTFSSAVKERSDWLVGEPCDSTGLQHPPQVRRAWPREVETWRRGRWAVRRAESRAEGETGEILGEQSSKVMLEEHQDGKMSPEVKQDSEQPASSAVAAASISQR